MSALSAKDRKSSQAVITAAVGVRAAGGDPQTKGAMARKASQAVFGANGESGADDAYQQALTRRKLLDSTIFEHVMDVGKVAKLYGADLDTGLDQAAAERNLADFGPNMLTPPIETPLWMKFMAHQLTGFALLLWGGAGLCYVVYILDNTAPDNLYLGIVLSVVVFFTGCFSFYQEYDAESTMAGFKSLTPDKCTCVRNYEGWTHDTRKGEPCHTYEATNLVMPL